MRDRRESRERNFCGNSWRTQLHLRSILVKPSEQCLRGVLQMLCRRLQSNEREGARGSSRERNSCSRLADNSNKLEVPRILQCPE